MSKIFDDMMDELKRETKIETGTVLLALMKAANASGMMARTQGDTLVVEQGKSSGGLSSNTAVGYYDLKPAFQNSKSVRMSKSGNWYVIVPIRRKTKSMATNLYKQARNISMGTTERLENLLENRPEDLSPFGMLPSNLNALSGQQDLSGNITRYSNGKGRGSRYIAFRTVNANSPANSWIVRYNMDTDELDKTQSAFDEIVNGVVK